jgi:hypothetical protein
MIPFLDVAATHIASRLVLPSPALFYGNSETKFPKKLFSSISIVANG